MIYTLQSESVIGDEDTLPIRFRSLHLANEPRISEGEVDDVEIDLGLSGSEGTDDEFKVYHQLVLCTILIFVY